MIIPAINCPDFISASRNIRLAERFLSPSVGWIHIDISDGKFSDTESWGDVEEFLNLRTRLNMEVHLMVEEPEKIAGEWLKAGAKRFIVSVRDKKAIKRLVKEAKKYKAEIVPSFDLETSNQEALSYLEDFNYVHVLAINPGPSGQSFNFGALEKIEFLRGQNRGVKIEVDGGINPETGMQALGAGADVLIVGSYIFENDDPALAYRELESLI
ncbi:hypothetical protein KKH05_02605 [Patescibacteria group bacterium]|nr:hypothetical protein [Patescibacteria group bacterium]